MNFPKPPTMQAPDRARPVMHAPNIPVSIKRQAEALVVQAAKEFIGKGDGRINHTDLPEWDRLRESVRVLNTIEGK